MAKQLRSVALRYGLALVAFALLLLVSFGLERILSFRLDITPLFIALMIVAAWYGGRGPGLVVAIAFELTIDYFAGGPYTLRFAAIVINRMFLFVSLVLFASSRRKAERELRRQREWFRVTLSSIGDAVIATDINGSINFINPTAEAITGWKMNEVAGKPLDQVLRIINEKTRKAVESPFAAIKREGVVVGLANHTVLISRDGKEIPIEDSGAPIKDSDGKTIGVIVVFHDTSERRRAEQEREQSLAREQAARNEAETANRMKDEFLATVSHELRTPLNAILGWASMLNRSKVEEETTSHAMSVIERNAKAQAEIIDDILDVSRIITGKLGINSRPVQLGPIIEAALDTLRPAATAKVIKLTVLLDPDAGFVLGDADRLQQIVWNLVSNAIKFTPSGGQVEVSLKRIDPHIDVKVRDTGIGISGQFLPYVFERFRQADASMSRAHGGLGLGLAIVRHLVEMHGGTVTAESDGDGRGAAFTVRLPVAAAHGLRALPARDSAYGLDQSGETAGDFMGGADLSGLRVLVVDDEPDTLEILTLILTRYGANVRVASSTAAAMEAFLESKPDVLVSDLGMAGDDGLVLIRKVRALAPEQGSNVPAAALTAYVGEEDRRRALAAGYQTHIHEPVDPAKLAAAVAGLAKGAK